MYTPHTVTVITSMERQDYSVELHATVLHGVFIDEATGANVGGKGTTDADSAVLFIPFSVDARDAETGIPQDYAPEKAYKAAEDKSAMWSIFGGGDSSAVDCFVIRGEAEPVEYEEARKNMDGVFVVRSVKTRDFGSPGMQHWQVGLR